MSNAELESDGAIMMVANLLVGLLEPMVLVTVRPISRGLQLVLHLGQHGWAGRIAGPTNAVCSDRY